MWTLLVERDDSGRHSGKHRCLTRVHRFGLGQGFLRILGYPRTCFRQVQEALVRTNTRDDVIELAGVDFGAETAFGTLPQKPDHRSTETAEAGAHQGEGCTVEELSTRHADDFRIRRRPRCHRNTGGNCQFGAARCGGFAFVLLATHAVCGGFVSRTSFARQHTGGFPTA